MSVCLWCGESTSTQVYWQSIFKGTKTNLICGHCSRKLHLIDEEICKECFKYSEVGICEDCIKWKSLFNGDDPLEKNISSFYYNDFMKDVIAKWKYRGDYELINMFREDIIIARTTLLQDIIKDAIIVPIPLSDERLRERGFNQALAIAELLTKSKLQIKHILTRINNEKQSKKTRSQRILTNNPFKILKKPNKNVILVDDIYTTGTTIRHAANLLKQNGSPNVYSYTLIRG